MFRHCPQCGSINFRWDDKKRFDCTDCGFRFYINAIAAVAALIENPEGRLLVTRRAREPAKGSLDLPGGFIDIGETAEQALRREIREELNLDIIQTRYFMSSPNRYEYAGMLYFTLDLAFQCRVSDFDGLRAGDDADECMFLEKTHVRPEEFGLESIRHILRHAVCVE